MASHKKLYTFLLSFMLIFVAIGLIYNLLFENDTPFWVSFLKTLVTGAIVGALVYLVKKNNPPEQ